MQADETGKGGGEGKPCLAGGGTMGRLMRGFDWSGTPVGPPSGWPQGLRTAVQILLNSRYPMFLWWGPELTYFYNDAYLPTLGPKHPAALGRPAAAVWAEIWDTIGPQTEGVLARGEATWNEELLLFLGRNGYPEETYHTFSYSPVADDDGKVRGVFCAVMEETQRVLHRRRLRTLREVAARTTGTKSAEAACVAACEAAAEAIVGNPHDLPFSLIYLIEDEPGRPRGARLAGASGLELGSAAAPGWIGLAAADRGHSWSAPIQDVVATGRVARSEGLAERFGPLRCGVWPEPPRAAIVLPLNHPGQDRLAGVLIAGISPRRALDDDYRGFLDLLAGQIANAIADARAYEEERRRAESLAALDRAKIVFFSNVSHEFRTPLTLLQGPVEDLLSDRVDPPTPAQRERLEVVHRNALRLRKLVNTLLDFSRIEAGRIQAVFRPVDLAALTAELASNFRSACERAGLALRVACPPLPEPVYIDRDLWEKVVFNLLSNAFKYTFEGSIEVTMRASGGAAVLSVRDTGTGIPFEEIPRLFERFHRIENARGRTQEGTGIGLALVRELVHLHGGEVEAESQPGQGSVFTVSIPLGKAHLPADRIEPARALVETGSGAAAYVEEVLSWLSGASAGAGRKDGEAAPSGRPRILLADDNADMREHVRRLLADRYDVEAVADGLAALESARQSPPALIVSDVMMPGLDGFALIRALRDDPATADLPVILLSARAGEEARAEGLDAGADDYLSKPFSARTLLASVASNLKLSGHRRAAAESSRRGEEQVRLLLNSTGEAIYGLDTEGRCTFCNPTCVRLLGYERPEDLLGRDMHDLVHHTRLDGTPNPAEECRISLAIRRGEGTHVDDEVLWRADGTSFPAEYWSYPIRNGDQLVGSVVTFVDITERRRLEDSLRDQAEQLREEDRRKNQFLATLAHELRNPLAPIRNVLHLMKQASGDLGSLEPDRAMAERQVVHLARLIDDLMDVARISRGKIELQAAVVDLETIVRQAIETARPLIDERGHTLEVTLPGAPIRVEADPTRLEQVLWNLLNNAAKYTEPGGEIALEVEAERSEAVVRVRDSGLGISAEMLPRVFDMFVQVGQHRGHAQGGLGIGLSLVRTLVELHGGRIAVRSDGPGQGSEFTVRLPILAGPAAPRPGSKAPEARGGDGASLPRRRILVVDDNRDAARSLARVLSRLHGQDVEVAHDGASALVAAEAFRPELILLDIGLPDINGYDVAAALRRRPEFRETVIAALTGWGQERDRRRSHDAGIDRHLVKPVDPEAIVELLQAVAR